MFDVYINDGKHEVPTTDVFYIIGKDGVYLRKKLGMIDAIVPVKKISFLGDVTPSARYDLPKIPIQIFSKIISLFKTVYEIHKSECVALLYYNDKTKKFKVNIPHQKVSGASAKYLASDSFKDFIKISTIHSHSSMSAFHSGTDDADEKDVDGLHITVGKLDYNGWYFDISVSIVFNGYRFIVNPEEYIENLKCEEVEEPQVESLWHRVYGIESMPDRKVTKKKYILDVNDDLMTFDKKWLDKIAKQELVYTHSSYAFPHYKLNQEIINSVDFERFDTKDIKNDRIPCDTCVFSNYKILKEIDEEEEFEEDEKTETGDLLTGTEYNYRQMAENFLLNNTEKGGDKKIEI